MYEKKILTVSYPTGYIDIYVGHFFGTSNKSQINKLLRLAKRHCSDKERKTLIEYLRFERNYRENVLETQNSLEEQRLTLLGNFSFQYRPTKRWTGPSEKELTKQVAKLNEAIDVVKEARWNSDGASPVD